MVLRVQHPGLSTTLQDLGRPGHRRLGVPLGGASDRRSLVLANALVGNPPSAAALEFTATGGSFVAESPLLLAIAGAPLACRHLGAAGAEFRFTDSRSFALRPGDGLQIDGCPGGLRAYLAVRGGGSPTRSSAAGRARDE